MTKNLKQSDGKSYLSAPKTSATMNINGIDYLVESYYVGNKNIHDTIIRIQRIRQCKRKQTDMGEMSIFSGIVYCADCGKKMYLCRCSKSTQKEYFNSSTYRKKSKSLCSSHQITVEAVEHIVLTDLQRALGMAKDNEKQFVDILQTAKSKEIRKDLSAKTKECDEAEKRVAENAAYAEMYDDRKIKGAHVA